LAFQITDEFNEPKGSFWAYPDILATPLGSQVAKEVEFMLPKSKNQRMSHTIAPSQRAAADASSLREVRLDEKVEQAPR